jgi:aspartate ammonia-lyase
MSTELYFGPQTRLAKANFALSSVTIADVPNLIEAMVLVKLASAIANLRLGKLSASLGEAIIKACEDILSGQHRDSFIVDAFQGGAGTSTNMNVNEVIANVALRNLGHEFERYDIVHPNDHVNLHQSTNDVYPTAFRVAILKSYPRLCAALSLLVERLSEKATEFADIQKLGRTQLQDAVPMTLGLEFGAFAASLREDIQRIKESALLMTEVNIGGTAIGSGINAVPGFSEIVIAKLGALVGVELRQSENLFEASWDAGAYMTLSSALKRNAIKLSKISNDLRLLSSGPRGGLGEISLPPVQAGSSIMPGKVNPVIPEVVSQVAYQIAGSDLTVTMAADAGQLQLNAMEPVIVFNVLSSISLLANVVETLPKSALLASRRTANSASLTLNGARPWQRRSSQYWVTTNQRRLRGTCCRADCRSTRSSRAVDWHLLLDERRIHEPI